MNTENNKKIIFDTLKDILRKEIDNLPDTESLNNAL